MSRRTQDLAKAIVVAFLAVGGLAAATGCQTAQDEKQLAQVAQAATPTPAAWNTQYDVPHYDVGPMPTYFRYDSVTDPWPAQTIDACKAFTTPETPPNSQPTRDCMCTNCMDWVHQCDSLQGCREVVQCAARVGCTDSFSCYLFPAVSAKDPTGKGCQAEIDKWGNSGLSTFLAIKMQDCSKAANCPLPP